MKQTNKSTKLLLNFVILLLLIIVAGTIVFKKEIMTLKKSQQSLLQENSNLKKQISNVSPPQEPSSAEAAIGSPCGVNNLDNSNILNPNGLQCYFYDSQDSNGNNIFPRRGVWIKPDLRYPLVNVIPTYENYIKSWKKYVSPDKTITFFYPQNWEVNELNWKDGVLSIQSNDFLSVSISKIENNAITMEQRISADEKDSTFIKTNIDLNGSDGIRLDIAPKDNLSDQAIVYFFQKDKYYVEINIAKTGYAIYDFPTEYLLSTIKIK